MKKYLLWSLAGVALGFLAGGTLAAHSPWDKAYVKGASLKS